MSQNKKEELIEKLEKLEQIRKDMLIRLSALEDQIADFRGDLNILLSKDKD